MDISKLYILKSKITYYKRYDACFHWSGLEIQSPQEQEKSRWIGVEPIEGGLVVIMGDLSHIISNGQFKTTMHRAVVNKTHHRVSAAYFAGPPKNLQIGPLTDDKDHPPIYRRLIWEEYLAAKATHFNKALTLFRC